MERLPKCFRVAPCFLTRFFLGGKMDTPWKINILNLEPENGDG